MPSNSVQPIIIRYRQWDSGVTVLRISAWRLQNNEQISLKDEVKFKWELWHTKRQLYPALRYSQTTVHIRLILTLPSQKFTDQIQKWCHTWPDFVLWWATTFASMPIHMLVTCQTNTPRRRVHLIWEEKMGYRRLTNQSFTIQSDLITLLCLCQAECVCVCVAYTYDWGQRRGGKISDTQLNILPRKNYNSTGKSLTSQ